MIRYGINAVLWSLCGGMFGLLAIVVYNIIRAKLNETNKK